MIKAAIEPKINKKNFRRVLAIIKKEFKKELKDGPSVSAFDYTRWFYADKKHKTVGDVVEHPCGTAACVGGWGCILALFDENPEAKLRHGTRVMDDSVAHEFFGISYDSGYYLFYGGWHHAATAAPTKDVIAKMENIIKTGLVINPKFDMKYKTNNY